MNRDSFDWKWQLGIDLGWQTAVTFVRSSVLFTVLMLIVVIGMGILLLVSWFSGAYAFDTQIVAWHGADLGTTLLLLWLLSVLVALTSSLPFALFNGIAQGIWAALTAEQLDDTVILRVLMGRVLVINVVGLPLLIMLILALVDGNADTILAGLLVALSAALPVGMVAYTAAPDVAEWYIQSPYCPKRKRKSK